MQLIKKNIWIIFLLTFFNNHVIAEIKFLSLKNNKVNVRYGPGFDYPVKFFYKKKNLPVKIIDKKENWRKIIDLKKNNGWIHRTQLKTSNSFIILEDKILFKKNSLFSKPIAKLNRGRLLTSKKCKKEWCNVKTDKYYGWIKINNIWGKIN